MNLSQKKKIVVADDEQDVLLLVCQKLKSAGYSTLEASDGEAALNLARQEIPDLLILDLMMPRMTGLEVCRSLKTDPATSSIPILILTAKAEELDRIVGFELGADDYVTKPFSPRELLLRVQSILRRSSQNRVTTDCLKIGNLTLDRFEQVAYVGSEKILLTSTEVRLLWILMERKGRVQSRDVLLKDVWSYENSVDSRTVDTHIKRLRLKLGELSSAIETVRGFGYRIPDPSMPD